MIGQSRKTCPNIVTLSSPARRLDTKLAEGSLDTLVEPCAKLRASFVRSSWEIRTKLRARSVRSSWEVRAKLRARFVRSSWEVRAKLHARFVRSPVEGKSAIAGASSKLAGGSCEALCQVPAKLVGGSCEAPCQVRAKLHAKFVRRSWAVRAKFVEGSGRNSIWGSCEVRGRLARRAGAKPPSTLGTLCAWAGVWSWQTEFLKIEVCRS